MHDAFLKGQRLAVVGTGIAGMAAGLAAVRAGACVSMITKDAPPEDDDHHYAATYAAAGMLTPNTEVDAPIDVIELGRQSLSLWPQWLERFNSADLLQRGGCWVFSHQHDRAYFNEFMKRCERVNIDSNADIRSSAPHSQFSLSHHFPDECWVNPSAILTRLYLYLKSQDVAFYHRTTVETISSKYITLNSEAIPFDWILDCRGEGALRDETSLRGVRGERIEVFAPHIDIQHLVRLIHPRYAIYIVPREGSRYVIGATQIDSNDKSPVSVRSALELLSAAYSIDKGFGEARIVSLMSHCRPTFPDHRPKIYLRQPGLISINGLFRHGMLLGPQIAEEAMSLLKIHIKENTCKA